MRPRRRTATGNKRKVIGAVAIAGVLAAAGISGVQLASANERAKSAIIEVDGQPFDVSGCRDLQINEGDVQCDNAALQPANQQGSAQAAEESALELEKSCDDFAAEIIAAGAGNNNADDAESEDQPKKAELASCATRKNLSTFAGGVR